MQIRNFTKKTIFTITGLFFFHVSFSQKNFLPGYIISLKGDTLKGLINFTSREKSPTKISFKRQQSEADINYSVLDISGFGVLDEIYQSAIIKTEVSPENTGDLKPYKELVIETDTAFLQTMVQGEKSLYFYKNKVGKGQFYIKEDSGYELLIYKKFLKDQEGIQVVAENKSYLNQLSVYLQNCSSMHSKLQSLEYNKKSMESLLLSYYDCTKSGIKFHKKTSKTTTEVGMTAGLALTSLSFNGTDFQYLSKAAYSQSTGFAVGLFCDIILPANNKRWSIYNELAFTSANVKGQLNEYDNESKYTITNLTFGYSYLKLNNMVRFKMPVRNAFVYLSGGITNGFAVSETNNQTREIKFYSTERTESDKALPETRKHEQGYIFGLGTRFKKYSFEVRYEKGNGISEYASLSSSSTRLYFLLGYKF